ncbi:MAG: WD40 repeat domain-containing protein [Gemmataceae bacterium]|nr:WD40 repeat domain-containing protein [Gemmataceae bacterium]
MRWVGFSPDGRHLAVRDAVRVSDHRYDAVVTAFDARTGRPVASVRIDRGENPLRRTVSPSSLFTSTDRLAYGDGSKLRLLALRPGQPLGAELDFRGTPVRPGSSLVGIDPAGRTLYAVAEHVEGYAVRRAELGDSPGGWVKIDKVAEGGGEDRDLLAVALDPAAGRFVAAIAPVPGGKPAIDSWTLGDEPAKTTLTPPHTVAALAFAPGGQKLAIGDDSGAAGWYDLADGNALAYFPNLTLWTTAAVAFSPDGKYLAGGSLGRGANLFLLDVAGEALAARLPVDPAAVVAVAFSPDGKRLAVAGGSGAVTIWDVADLLKTGKE